jgi:Carboxypeptidase regulatory-like domain
MVEVFTKPGTDSEAVRQRIWNATGMMPAIYDNGTHYVTNHRLTLEMLKQISDSEEVLEVAGDYTGSITGLGASRDIRNHNKMYPPAAAAASSSKSSSSTPQQQHVQQQGLEEEEKKGARAQEQIYKEKRKWVIGSYKPLIYTVIGIVAAIAIAGFIISGGNPPNTNQDDTPPTTSTTTSPSAVPVGALHGYVGGPAGLPAVGASVIAANQETGHTENAIISVDGQYFLGNLPSGEYIVMVAYPDGTNKVVNEFQVESGSNHELNFSY